ncbi:MAG: hypothetical protein DRN68_07470 [Thaumarchaeota archaeon]|nr:MAG: hypothetical protein DRN68_07470 [Nitrososphaerota archaeon]
MWVKVAGYLGGGLKLEQTGKRVIAVSSIDLEKDELERLVLLETGLWHPPFEDALKTLPKRFRIICDRLSSIYPGVRIPIAPHDFEQVFISILLSKRANYDIVRRWCREIWEKFPDGFEELLSKEPEFKKISRSYQLSMLIESIKDLLKLREDFSRIHPNILQLFGRPGRNLPKYILSLPPELARLVLLSIKGVGPKTADSILLTTFMNLENIPCDVHLLKFVSRMRILKRFREPEKNFCRRFLCKPEYAERWGISVCPRAIEGECVRYELVKYFGELSEWIQTLIYLHGRDYCRSISPRCEECPLRDLCPSRITSR